MTEEVNNATQLKENVVFQCLCNDWSIDSSKTYFASYKKTKSLFSSASHESTSIKTHVHTHLLLHTHTGLINGT